MQAQPPAVPGVAELSLLQGEIVILERLLEMTDLAIAMSLGGTTAHVACCWAMVEARHRGRGEG